MGERGKSYEGNKPAGSTTITEHRVALVIGNARYSHAGTLQNPGNDAIGMERSLRAFGFDVIGGEQNGIDLDYGALATRIRDFGRCLRQTNPVVALLFYAGHGLQVDGRNYIMPVDAALEMQSDVGAELFELQHILNQMEHPSRTSLVFLDACRNNPLVRNLAQAMGLDARDARLGEGLAEQKVAAGTLIAYATQPGHIAYDGKGDNGYLTEALLAEMGGHPERDVELLLRDVRVRVLNATQELARGPQVPWVHTSLLGAFAFQPDRQTTAEQSPQTFTDTSVTAATTARGSLEWSQEQWETLKDSTDIAQLQRFADHAHPYYAGEASERIAVIQAAESERLEAEARARRETEEKERKAKAQAERYRAEGRIWIDATYVDNESGNWFLPGAGNRELFKDIDFGPEMVVVPAGKFMMGSPKDEPEREHYSKDSESPQHEVTIAKPFAVGRCAVTFDEWDAALKAGGVTHKPGDEDWGRGQRPVINVSWQDARDYAAWLSEVTGQPYRLLTDAEWEYVTRAGTATPFWWGTTITPLQANYDGNHAYEADGSTGTFREKTVPVDDFEPNPWGLFNVHGNVYEWCEDVWHDSYEGAPSDGSSWSEGGEKVRRVGRGGSWYYIPGILRSANRDGYAADGRVDFIGFRLARTLSL